MTPSQLADKVESTIRDCRERVEGIGAQQYYVEGQPQKFETMPLDGLLEYIEEEARDLINYGVMVTIRIQRLRATLAPTIELIDAVRDLAQYDDFDESVGGCPNCDPEDPANYNAARQRVGEALRALKDAERRAA